jgi:hypothetical protein
VDRIFSHCSGAKYLNAPTVGSSQVPFLANLLISASNVARSQPDGVSDALQGL